MIQVHAYRPCVTLLSARAIFAKVCFYTVHLDEVVRPVRKKPNGRDEEAAVPAPLLAHGMCIVRVCESCCISTLIQ